MSKRANEGAQGSARVERAGWSKRMSERCERMSEQASEWPSTYLLILDCSEPLWVVVMVVVVVTVHCGLNQPEFET